MILVQTKDGLHHGFGENAIPSVVLSTKQLFIHERDADGQPGKILAGFNADDWEYFKVLDVIEA